MLSAIAARKAAHAAKQQPNPQNDASEVSNMILRERSTPVSTSKLEQSPGFSVTSDSEAAAIPQKRKAKRQDFLRKTVQKKAKRLTNSDVRRARYFEAEQPPGGFDGDDPQSPHPQPHSSQEDGLISGFITEDPGPSRGYSPSRPILDSSEDESRELVHEKHYSLGKKLETDSIVSLTASRRLFFPKLDSNCFRLTSDDLKGLDGSQDVGSGTLLLLPPGHSLTFVGTASITLLQGAVAVLGMHLRPSLHSHRVFSPRCSPLASIETLDVSSVGGESNNSNSPNWGRLPRQIQNAVNPSDCVVLIQPLSSGVEGLGKVCRLFDGVFDVAPDLRDTEVEDAIGVERFHPVGTNTIKSIA